MMHDHNKLEAHIVSAAKKNDLDEIKELAAGVKMLETVHSRTQATITSANLLRDGHFAPRTREGDWSHDFLSRVLSMRTNAQQVLDALNEFLGVIPGAKPTTKEEQ